MSHQSAASCIAVASRLAATCWLKKLTSLITYMTENQETINQYLNMLINKRSSAMPETTGDI
jgi:hypothetical protein